LNLLYSPPLFPSKDVQYTTLSAHSPFPRPFLAQSVLAGLVLTLTGCLSDGPNETGKDFLAGQKVTLQSTAYEVTLDSIPLENFHTSLDEPSHLGDTVLMLGQWQGVRSEVRLGFSLTNTTLLDQLDNAAKNDSIQVRLSLGLFNWGGYSDSIANPTQKYLESTLAGRDSLTLVVTTLDAPDSVSQTSYEQAVQIGEPSFLRRKLPIEALKEQFSKANKSLVETVDTIVLDISNVYGMNNRDSILIQELPQLRKRLIEKRYARRYMMVRIQPLRPPSASDSNDVMLRIVGGASGAYYMPALYIGKTDKPSTSSGNPDRLDAYTLANSVARAATYMAEDLDSLNQTLTVLPQKGVRFQLDRDLLISKLRQKGLSFSNPINSEYDFNYFVSYAEMILPLDSAKTKIENNYSLDMGVVSNLDSLADGAVDGASTYSNIPLDSTHPNRSKWRLLWVLDANQTLSGNSDTVKFSFETSPDPTTQFLRFTLASDTSTDLDTLHLKAGMTREMTISAGSRIPLFLSVTSNGHSCDITYRLRMESREENRNWLNPKTKEPYTDYADLSPRLLSPKKQDVALRATNGIQRILNRKTLGDDIFQEFLVKIITKDARQTDSLNLRVNYPILGRVQFPQTDGKIFVKLHLLLFPLQQP
jgi:hypothetical protein